jgi:acyl-CoA synthetase (AMP-forming)/AMP-acid ligase II
VALVGDFDARSIATMLRLIDRNVVLVPLAEDSAPQHDYFFEHAHVNLVIRQDQIERRAVNHPPHPLLEELRQHGSPGLVLFSSGSTGRPKAILHDFSNFLMRYRTPRPTWRTLNFLLFDHIGGINTLFHTLFNRGVIVVPSARTPEGIVEDIRRFEVELLPTTPTFLRMLLLSDLAQEVNVPTLRVVTYGTERMDQPTLDRLAQNLAKTDFRQTYGMSELGILRVKSRARDSLWIQVGGEGVETRVVDGVLQIRSRHRMLGYLNAPDPFQDGWYDTGDLIEEDAGFIKIVGRAKEVINVGGLKVLPSEIERVALLHPDILRAKALGVDNPLIGQHIEVTCQPRPGSGLDRQALRGHFAQHLPPVFRPHRIRIGEVRVSHRFKQE